MVSPTWANTPIPDTESKKTPQIDYAVKRVINDRAAQPEDVAAAIMYLCGPTAANVTGSNLTIDGSLTTEPNIT
jgi:NAD(P)-dependent dehydrogenase (short-subunit alcohol dehydrogenase family)